LEQVMAEDVIDNEAVAQPSGGMMKKLVFAGIGLVLIGAGVFAGMTLLGGDTPADGEELVEDASPASGPALYTSLHPPLVVNFKDNVGDSHFMQITMEVMARKQTIINSVREHTPVIRNSLILLYSGVIYEEIITRDGKEKMLADGLAEIQKVMTEQIGEPGVEAVYFTALVIQ
jgi:flagellar FliL protein